MGAPTEAPSCPFSRSVPGWHGQQQPCAGPDCSTRLSLTSCSACRKEAGVSFCTWVTASRCRRKARKRCRKARKCSAAGGTQWWPHGGHGRRRPGPRCDARPGSIRNAPIPRSRSLGVSSCAASWPDPLRCAALILPALRLASGTDTPGRPPPRPPATPSSVDRSSTPARRMFPGTASRSTSSGSAGLASQRCGKVDRARQGIRRPRLLQTCRLRHSIAQHSTAAQPGPAKTMQGRATVSASVG